MVEHVPDRRHRSRLRRRCPAYGGDASRLATEGRARRRPCWPRIGDDPVVTPRTPRFVTFRVGWLLVGVGLVCGIVAGFVLVRSVGPAFKDALVRPACPTPCSEALDLEAGHYLVFEEIGRSTSVGPFSSTTQGLTTITPDEVAVTSPTGQALEIGQPTSSQTIERGGTIYGGAVSFEVPAAGRYRIAVDAPGATRILVAPGLGQTFLRALPGIGVAGLGGAVGLTGVVLLIMAWIRRRHAATATAGGHHGLG